MSRVALRPASVGHSVGNCLSLTSLANLVLCIPHQCPGCCCQCITPRMHRHCFAPAFLQFPCGKLLGLSSWASCRGSLQPTPPSLSKMHFETSAVVIWVCVTGSANIIVTEGESCGPMPYSGALQDIAPETAAYWVCYRMGSRSCNTVCLMASSDRVINQQGTYYLQWKTVIWFFS